jgi:cobalt/nickel transport system permease protein
VFIIEQYAYSNKLKNMHPGEKMAFALLSMLIAVSSKSAVIHLLVLSMMAVVCLAVAGIPWKAFGGLMLLPLSFILLGVLPILIVISNKDVGFIVQISLFHRFWGITAQGLHTSVVIFFRSMSAAACLYFIALTTPLTDMIEMLRRLRLPAAVIEIMFLIYRFIFVLLEAAGTIYHSQSSRLGYSGLRNSFYSLGKLVSMVFIKAYHNSQVLFIALASRGYEGELAVIPKEYQVSRKNILIIAVTEALLMTLLFLLGGR